MRVRTLANPAQANMADWPQVYRKVRYDYFLVWGNGMPHFEKIVELLDDEPDFEVAKIIRHTPASIEALINAVYSYDYAPIEHLRAKTQYLLKSQPDVAFIFLKNLNAVETYMGRDRFRHIECMRIKALKESIRNSYNPRVDGKRTEEHVIHASDNELQTDHILRYLGYNEGTKYLKRVPNVVLKSPCHLPDFRNFRITSTATSNLLCRILSGCRSNHTHKIVPITETPHYKALTGDTAEYEKYIDEFGGYLLKDNHNLRRLLNLKNSLSYLSGQHKTGYIITERTAQGSYLILDGVHRASALAAAGVNKCLVGVIS